MYVIASLHALLSPAVFHNSVSRGIISNIALSLPPSSLRSALRSSPAPHASFDSTLLTDETTAIPAFPLADVSFPSQLHFPLQSSPAAAALSAAACSSSSASASSLSLDLHLPSSPPPSRAARLPSRVQLSTAMQPSLSSPQLPSSSSRSPPSDSSPYSPETDPHLRWPVWTRAVIPLLQRGLPDAVLGFVLAFFKLRAREDKVGLVSKGMHEHVVKARMVIFYIRCSSDISDDDGTSNVLQQAFDVRAFAAHELHVPGPSYWMVEWGRTPSAGHHAMTQLHELYKAMQLHRLDKWTLVIQSLTRAGQSISHHSSMLLRLLLRLLLLAATSAHLHSAVSLYARSSQRAARRRHHRCLARAEGHPHHDHVPQHGAARDGAVHQHEPQRRQRAARHHARHRRRLAESDDDGGHHR